MFRDRPLTWLFILATVVVDLTMFFGGGGAIFNGILVGQVAATAIWAAIGHSHRLTRGSLLVVTVGVLAILPVNGIYENVLTFMASYALVIVATSSVVVWLRNRILVRLNGDREKAPLKVPLIEFFGWTIVVAVASFGARYIEIDRCLESVLHFPFTFLLLYAVAPVGLLMFDSRYCPLHLVKAVLFVGGVYLVATSLESVGQIDVVEWVPSVATYLTAWLLVRSIEYDQLKTAEEDPDSEEQNGEIKLFDAKQ